MSAFLQVMNDRERALLEHCVLLPRSLIFVMAGLTNLGNGWLWLATLALVAKGSSLGPLRVVLAAAMANLAIALSKAYFRRPRPASEAAALAGCPLAFDRFSFPSGHTTNAFAWAGCAGSFAPALAPVFVGLACLIGVSRVLLRTHFPSDVVAGALIGWSLGLLAARVVI
jgi:undecaprenyl-diphosphatase